MINLAQPSFIFVALACEAKPLIQAWRLKKQLQKSPFPIYSNSEIVLVVSGIGKIAMAASVAYTMAKFNPLTSPILLNIGVAGHRSQGLGNSFLVEKISDTETQRRFYPQFIVDVPGPTLPLITSSKADATYTDDNLHDMEASAFYEIAVKFSSSELIHCLKVVSDNAESPLHNINEDLVAAWVEACLSKVEDLLSLLTKLRKLLPISGDELRTQLLEKYHFTAANALRLEVLLNRWQLTAGDTKLNVSEAKALNAAELLAWLENQIENSDYYL